METYAVGALRNHTTNDPDGFRGYLLYTAGTPTNRGILANAKTPWEITTDYDALHRVVWASRGPNKGSHLVRLVSYHNSQN